MIQDKRLMMRFNRGDAAALRDIYGLYKDELVTLASALLYNKTAAKDAVHDAFAKDAGVMIGQLALPRCCVSICPAQVV
ncbi:MAG: hypothetical protein J7K65_07125 [Planctomycetes bacterium]|nr:hypothetical protein [Planctomycetota bacterium]